MNHPMIFAAIAAIGLTFSTCNADGPTEQYFTVCPSGCDYTSIQDAIDAAGGVKILPVILVSAGTYSENRINTNGLPITIEGEVGTDGTLLTTISGAGFDIDEESCIFTFNSNETPATILRNLKITGGVANKYSGGIQISDCSPTISSCIISENQTLATHDTYGGGIYMTGSYSRIEDCQITGNNCDWTGNLSSSGAGIYCKDGGPTLFRCQIRDNTITYSGNHSPCGDDIFDDPCSQGTCGMAEGIGVFADETDLTIIECVIVDNIVSADYDPCPGKVTSKGGGINMYKGSLAMTDTMVSNNWTLQGGGLYGYKSTLALSRCRISMHPSAGVLLNEGSGTFHQCLFDKNVLGIAAEKSSDPILVTECDLNGNGYGIGAKDSTFQITDSLLARNTDFALFARDDSVVDFTRSIISNNSTIQPEVSSGIYLEDSGSSVSLTAVNLCGNSSGGTATTANQTFPPYPNSQVEVDTDTFVVGTCVDAIIVSQDGQGEFTNIQDAIDYAPPGGTVRILAGTYPGGWTTRTRPITIEGSIGVDGLPTTIIDGGGTTGPVIQVVEHGASQLTIRNLDIRNGSTKKGGAGMSVTDASPTIVNCTFRENNTENAGGGISFTDSSGTLAGCRFIENAASPGGAVYVSGTSNVTSTGCEFLENSGGSGGGAIYVANGGSLDCNSSKFVSNSVLAQFQGGAILIAAGASADLAGNFLCGNTPDQISGSYTDGGNNELESGCISNTTVTVAADGNADFDTIQAAIGAVGNGSTIQIAAGDYAEELNTQGKAVRLVGSVDSNGEPATTIVPPQLKENQLLVCDHGEGRATVFENLAFYNGNSPQEGAGGVNCNGSSPTFINCVMENNFGYNAGGMYCENGSQPLLLECVFRRNTGGFLDSGPGGIASASGSNPALEGCVLCDNEPGNEEAPANIGGNWTDLGRNIIQSGACPQLVFVGPESSDRTPIQTAINDASDGAVIIIAAGSYPENLNTGGKALTLRGRVAQDGSLLTTIDGGGLGAVITCIEGESSTTKIENLIIRDGSEGGIRIANASPTVSECRIIQNNGPVGGGINATSSTAVITDCVIAFNEADLGGGIATSNASLLVKRCRLSNNTAIAGPGIATAGANLPGFQNTSLCGNLGPDGGRNPQIEGNYDDLGGNTISTACDIFVAQDGSGDYTTIQAAIDAADPPAVIVVAPGTYVENLNTQGKAVIIEGTLDDFGRRMTVVDGGQTDSVVSCISAETPETVIRNLVLTNGISTHGSGGIYIWQASPTIENCAIVGNQSYLGGGMSINTSTTTITGCLIAGNQSISSGGGLWISNTQTSADFGIRIIDSIITENSCEVNPGIALSPDASASIGGSAICGNTSGGYSALPQIGGPYEDLGGNIIETECPTAPCPGDLNGDLHIDQADLGLILAAWGPCPPTPASCPWDINQDGNVDAADLVVILAAWGACSDL